jgi:hypothetical protein
MRFQKRVLAAGLLAAAGLWAADDGGGWIAMFDGKTLDGWKAGDNPESWSVKDGKIVGDGERSHLFYMLHECENCEFKMAQPNLTPIAVGAAAANHPGRAVSVSSCFAQLLQPKRLIWIELEALKRRFDPGLSEF